MSNYLVNKENKDYFKSNSPHGRKKFQRKGCFPCFVSFLRVNSVDYGCDFFGFLRNSIIISPPHIKITNISKYSPQETEADK